MMVPVPDRALMRRFVYEVLVVFPSLFLVALYVLFAEKIS